MYYTAEEIMDWDDEQATATPAEIDKILRNHGCKRGSGVDDYKGPNNLKTLAIWLGY